MKELTKQQSKVLACVEVYLNKTGFPPTRAEICKELGFKSPNAAEMHLRALEKKGYITIQSGSSRGISIVKSQQSLERIGDQIPVIGLVAAGSPTLEDEVTLKYFKQTDHNLELIPANKDFSTIEVDLREQEAFVEGKSVGLIRTH